MNYRLSVILPTYNRRDRLEKSLLNYLEENIPCIEFIILDNASTDGTQELIQSIIKQDSRVKYFKNPQNIGYNRSLYRGFLEASSDWITILADDDLMETGYIAELLEVIENNSDCAIIANALKNQISNDDYKITTFFDKTTKLKSGYDGIKTLFMCTGAVPGFTFNKKLIDQKYWLLDSYIYPQIRIAVMAASLNDVVYFKPTKYIKIPQNDSVMIRVKDAMGRPLDYGIIERINILLDVSKKLPVKERNQALNELSFGLFSFGVSVFKMMYKEDKQHAFQYFSSLLKHPFIRSSLLFWVSFIDGLVLKNGVSLIDKIKIMLYFIRSLFNSILNKNLYRSFFYAIKKTLFKVKV